MNLRQRPSYFSYTKSQRSGLLVLFALVVALQAALVFIRFKPLPENRPQQQAWLALQPQFDSLAKIKPKRFERRPFNPNFITDFKGYQLGMSVAEIDRLLAFRKTNRYVNSGAEFQKVTGVSDSLLASMEPWFKFPDWVKNKKPKVDNNWASSGYPKKVKSRIDLNHATADDLKAVYGIGDGLSKRILEQKEKLGGFVSMAQMEDIWGLSPEVIQKLNESFQIGALPTVKKIKINEASVKELSQFPYFRYPISREIVTFRSMNGEIDCAEDLLKISAIPVEKVSVIALYLEF